MGYFKEAVKGVSWTIALRVITRAMALVKVILVARIIGPKEFGIYGIAALILAFLEVLTETGINVFLVQENKKLEDFIDTSWVISIIRGVIISLLIIILALPVSFFFDSNEVVGVLLLTSLIPLVRGFINPAIVKFQKDLEFDKEFYFFGFIYLIDTIIALVIAYFTGSAESIVLGILFAAFAEVIMSWLIIRPTPRFTINNNQFKKVINRGKWVTASGIFNYLFMQGDDIIVGRLMNTTSLGYYQMAYKIGTVPITEIHNTFAKVSFPIYSKIRDDLDRLLRAFVKTSGTIVFGSIVFLLFIFLFSDILVRTLLGNEWLEIVPVIKVLSIFGTVRSMTGSFGTLFLSLKKQEYRTAFTFAGIIGIALTIFPLVKTYGILGASYSALIGAVVELPVAGFFLVRIIRQNRSKITQQ